MAVIDEIDRLSRRRQALWAGAPADSPAEVSRITTRLADLYEQKRHDHARTSSRRRAEIVRRARVEWELERLVVADRTGV